MIVAGIDIGFRNTGVSIFNIDLAKTPRSITYIASDCFSSKKIKSQLQYVSHQDAEDVRNVMTRTVEYLRAYMVELVVIELPTGGAKSSRAARALGIATAESVMIPMMVPCAYIFVSPRDVKIATTGDPYAEKDAIISAMTKKFPSILSHKKAKQEHICDSVGCVLSVLQQLK